MKTIFDLPHKYDVAVDVELSSGPDERLFEFAPANGAAARTRCLVKVCPTKGSSWTGRFAGDYDEPLAISVVLSSPDPKRMCVVCSGRGYLVDTGSPEEFGLVECFPICSVRAIGSLSLLVFGNFTDLVAYDRTGLKWKIAGLMSDELKIVDLHGELLVVDGLDTATGHTVRASVDLRTGRLAV